MKKLEAPLHYVPSKPWVPGPHQKKGVKTLISQAAAGLVWEPGMGKTSTVYGALKILFSKGFASRALIIAPLRPATQVWPAEVEKWIDFKDIDVAVLHGPRKVEELARGTKVCVINPEGLPFLLGAKDGKSVSVAKFKKLGFDTLIIDELTLMKTSSSGRFKLLKTVLHTFARRWGLTGSLLANGYMDLFGQCYVLDGGNALGQYITHYRNKYFTPTGFGGYTWVLQEGAKEKIEERVAPLMLRLSSEDYIKLPAMVPIEPIMVDLPPAAREIYDRVEEDMIAELEGKKIVAVNAASVSSKSLQVAGGAVYLTPDMVDLIKDPSKRKEWLWVHDAKIDALEDLVTDLNGSPLLVGYNFNHDLERILARFGKDTPYIGGGVSPKRAKEIEGAWNAGEIPLLLGHPQSMGHGLNLQGASNRVCWLSQPWDYELSSQFVGRVWRQGNTAGRMFVYRILARNTIDVYQDRVLRGKKAGQEAFFEALKELAKSRRSRVK